MRRLLAFACVVALGGCALIDQNTFAPEPDPPKPVGKVAAGIQTDSRVPLLTIRYDVPHPDYGRVLAFATHAADTRRPGVGYDVVTVTGSADDAAQGGQDAAEVAQMMIEHGTAPSRIHLGARIDPNVKVREVRLYLR